MKRWILIATGMMLAWPLHADLVIVPPEPDTDLPVENLRPAIPLNPGRVKLKPDTVRSRDAQEKLKHAIEAFNHRDYEDAKRRLGELTDLLPNNVEVASLCARSALELREFDEAETFALQALRIQPTDVSALHTLGFCLIAREEHAQAAGVYHRLRSLTPDDAAVCYVLGRLQATLKDTPAAVVSYTMGIRLQPNHRPMLSDYADLLIQNDKANLARPLLLRALAMDLAVERDWQHLVRILQKDYPDIGPKLRALTQSLNNADLHLQIGTLLAKGPRPEDAVPFLQAAIGIRGKIPEASRLLEDVRARLN